MSDRERFNDDEGSDKDDSSSSDEDGSSGSDDADEGEDDRQSIRDDSDEDDDEEEGNPKKQEEYEDEVEQLKMEEEEEVDDKKKGKERKSGGVFSRRNKNKEDRPEQPGISSRESKKEKRARTRKIGLILLLILVILAIIGTVIFLALFLSGMDKDKGSAAKEAVVSPAPSISSAPSQSTAPSMSPTISEGSNNTTPDEPEKTEEPSLGITENPTSAPTREITFTVTETELLELITANSPDNGAALLFDIESPQQAAFLWLQNVDNFWRDNLPEGSRRLLTEQERKKIEARALQRYRMMAFYYGADGKEWIEQGFWGSADMDECFWEFNSGNVIRMHVGCDNNERLTKLVFRNNNLGGFLVPELGQLTHLTELEIDNDGDDETGLMDGLPDTFRLLSKMELLKIIGNNFTEPIIGDLWVDWKVVKSINLARNGIPGPLPAASLAELNTLDFFHLGGNNLEGPMPPEIGGLYIVKQIVLANNNLEGDLPSQFSDLTKLNNLNLMYNKFTGPFPDIRKMTEFSGSFVLTGNSFSGQIPDYFDSVPKLKELVINKNNFSGTVPDLTPLTQLEIFEIDGNPDLSGQIPAEVCGVVKAGTSYVDCGKNPECPDSENRFCCECCACIAPETEGAPNNEN